MTTKCPLCGGARTAGTITFTAELGFGVLAVRHVPAQVCEQCGEEWLDDSVAAAIEDAVLQARARQSVVHVAEWQTRAAFDSI
jgi:YgiT-type zinc finger domain-containing protein